MNIKIAAELLFNLLWNSNFGGYIRHISGWMGLDCLQLSDLTLKHLCGAYKN